MDRPELEKSYVTEAEALSYRADKHLLETSYAVDFDYAERLLGGEEFLEVQGRPVTHFEISQDTDDNRVHRVKAIASFDEEERILTLNIEKAGPLAQFISKRRGQSPRATVTMAVRDGYPGEIDELRTRIDEQTDWAKSTKA